MRWRPDERFRKTVGPFEMVPVRDGSETAHEISLPDGRRVRVLPDPDYSGQKRSQTILRALTALHAAWRADADGVALFELADDAGRPLLDPLVVLRGYLGDLSWELVGSSVEEWLLGYFEESFTFTDDPTPAHYPDEVAHFLRALDDAGWAIVRKGEEG